MGWETSDRRAHLPSNWESLRKQRFRIDGDRCTAKNTYGERCTEPAEECDHIGGRTDHRIEMLRSLCKWHHGKKTGAQGAAQINARRREIRNSFRRPSESHPGDL